MADLAAALAALDARADKLSHPIYRSGAFTELAELAAEVRDVVHALADAAGVTPAQPEPATPAAPEPPAAQPAPPQPEPAAPAAPEPSPAQPEPAAPAAPEPAAARPAP